MRARFDTAFGLPPKSDPCVTWGRREWLTTVVYSQCTHCESGNQSQRTEGFSDAVRLRRGCDGMLFWLIPNIIPVTLSTRQTLWGLTCSARSEHGTHRTLPSLLEGAQPRHDAEPPAPCRRALAIEPRASLPRHAAKMLPAPCAASSCCLCVSPRPACVRRGVAALRAPCPTPAAAATPAKCHLARRVRCLISAYAVPLGEARLLLSSSCLLKSTPLLLVCAV